MLTVSLLFTKLIGTLFKRFRSRMSEAGFTISGDNHPICPVMLGDAKLASEMSNDLLKLGKLLTDNVLSTFLLPVPVYIYGLGDDV